MKRVAYLAALLTLAFGASAAKLDIDSVPSAIFLGDVGDVNVRIADIADLYAYQFDIAFNPLILSAISGIEGAFLSGGGETFFIPGAIDNSAGTITLTVGTLLGPLPGVSGSGILATIHFQSLSIGSSPITLSNTILLDSALSDIPADVQNGSAAVVIPEPDSASLFGSAIALGLSGLYWLKKR